MASTSNSPSSSKANELLVEQFCSVTGSSSDEAYKILEAYHWNLEMAINMQIESDVIETHTEPDVIPVEVEDEVRPPVPQYRAILVKGNSNFRYNLRERRVKRPYYESEDESSDSEDEAQIQELSSENGESSKKRRILNHHVSPPFDIIYQGSFLSARAFGQSSKRWLMVNIQNPFESLCQVLNRDLWSNSAVKNLVKKYFIFWQAYSNRQDGAYYVQFYNPVKFPCVAVIDPRTGEKLVEWHQVDVSTFCELVDRFLKEYSFDSDSESTNDKLIVNIEAPNHSNDTIDVVSSTESNDFKSKENWKDYLGSEDDPKSNLVLRLPDGKREQISWPCSTRLKSLLLYTNELGFDLENYKLVANFPPQNLTNLDSGKTLKEVDLFPREIITIQQKT